MPSAGNTEIRMDSCLLRASPLSKWDLRGFYLQAAFAEGPSVEKATMEVLFKRINKTLK